LIVSCEGDFSGGALRVDGIGIVDPNDLAGLERDRAIEAQRLNDAAVPCYKELSGLYHTSDRNTIDVVAENLLI
jgi:hypothetical protein